MYVGPDIIRPAGATQARRYAISTFAAVFALGLCLFLIAATIVLALIPIYIQPKSATLSPNARTSKVFSMYAPLVSTTGGRRRRQTNDLSTVVGGSFGSAGLALVRTTLLSTLSGLVNDVSVTSATIVYQGSSTNSYWLVIQGYVTYLTNCLLTCQSGTIGSIIQQKLYNTGSSINYPSVSIIKNGATLLANIIASSSQLYYVSAIIPGLSSSTPGTGPVTALSTSTATTPFLGG